MNDIYNPYLTQEDVIDLVQRQVNIFGGIRACARNFNIPAGDISHLFSGKRGPSPKLLEAFELQKVIYFVHKPHATVWAKKVKP